MCVLVLAVRVLSQAVFTSLRIPLDVTFSYGHDQLQRKLENVMFSRIAMSVATTWEFYY